MCFLLIRRRQRLGTGQSSQLHQLDNVKDIRQTYESQKNKATDLVKAEGANRVHELFVDLHEHRMLLSSLQFRGTVGSLAEQA